MFPKAIAFGGGGVRGILHVGGLIELEKRIGKLEFPNGIYGSSIGAVIATAVAFNLSANTIRQMLLDDFNVEDILPPIRIGNMQNILKEKGAFRMDGFTNTVCRAFEKQGIQLQSKTIQDAHQKLFIAVSDLTTRNPVFLTGSVPLLDALRCSCCVPLVFVPQCIGTHVYVDGGLYMRDIQSHVPEDCIVFTIDHTTNPLHTDKLQDYPFSDFIKHLFFSRRQPSRKYTLRFHEQNTELLQKIDTATKLKLLQEGELQCSTFLTECASEEGENIV